MSSIQPRKMVGGIIVVAGLIGFTPPVSIPEILGTNGSLVLVVVGAAVVMGRETFLTVLGELFSSRDGEDGSGDEIVTPTTGDSEGTTTDGVGGSNESERAGGSG